MKNITISFNHQNHFSFQNKKILKRNPFQTHNVTALSNKLQFAEHMLRKGYRFSSVAKYIYDTVMFIRWATGEKIRIVDVSYNNILAYILLIKPRLKQKTIACKINSLKHYYNFLLDTGKISQNPVSDVRIRGIKTKILYNLLTMNEMEDLYFNFLKNREKSYVFKSRFSPDALVSKRNKVILGLMVFQGLNTSEIADLDLDSISLQEGILNIRGSNRSNGRTLKLESHQIMDINEYLSRTRIKMLSRTGKQSMRLFSSTGKRNTISNVMSKMISTLRKINKKILSFRQIRASVINIWLKIYNLRYVQYMTGHRYVSSTESYIRNESETLFEDISKFHPVI